MHLLLELENVTARRLVGDPIQPERSPISSVGVTLMDRGVKYGVCFISLPRSCRAA
jgi:hypothetical protein